MSRYDPTDRNLVRMELRRFQSRCEAQEGTIRRADTIHEVSRLATVIIPFVLAEETDALDMRRQVKLTAEAQARDLFEAMLDQLVKTEPFARDKLRRSMEEEIHLFTGALNALRTWAYARLSAVEQTLRD